MTDRDFWLRERQALLLQVDNIERMLGIEPRTAELRQAGKDKEKSEHGAGAVAVR